jgi:hypothetical protein
MTSPGHGEAAAVMRPYKVGSADDVAFRYASFDYALGRPFGWTPGRRQEPLGTAASEFGATQAMSG